MSVVEPLSNEDLKRLAPSIFANSPSFDVSDKYAFVPTFEVLDNFRRAGYYPILAGESKVRDVEDFGYQKHLIQFRSMDNLLRPDREDEYADIVLTNSHNRTSSFSLDLAYFRVVCANMLVVPSHTFMHHSIIHKGFNFEKVDCAIDEITAYMPKMNCEIDRFKAIRLSPIEERFLARAGSDIRFDSSLYLVDENEFLKVNRKEDLDNSLWSVFNRVQEAMIRGGVRGVNRESGKSFTSKPINAIDTNLKLNKELFETVQKVANLIEPKSKFVA